MREAITAAQGYAYDEVEKLFNKFRCADAMCELAYNLGQQGRFAEAEHAARECLGYVLREFGPWHGYAGYALRTLGGVLFAQGRTAEAIALIEQALRIYEGAGFVPDARIVVREKAQLANILSTEGRWNESAKIYDQIAAPVAAELGRETGLFRDVGWALALIRTGRAGEGLEIARAAVDYRRKARGDDSYGTLEARGVHAIGLAGIGRSDAALAEFAEVVPRLLGHRGRSHSRDRWIRFIVDAYLDELEREARSGKGDVVALAERSFAAASALGAQGAQRAIAQAALRGAAGDPALAELVRSSQDTEQSLDAAERLLLGAMDLPAGEQSPSALAALRTRVGDLRRAQTVLDAEIARRFPRYAELKNPPPPSLAEARRVLAADQSLVVFYLTEDRTYIWAVPARGEVAFSAVPVKRSEIESRVDRVRKSVTLTGITLGDVPAFDVAAAHRLYELLLKPVESGWKNARNLVVAPDGPLGYLPFPLLVTGPVNVGADRDGLFSGYRAVPWLARTHAVSTVPSVSALMALRQPSSVPAVRQAFAGFGDPWFSAAQAAEGTAGPIQVASRGVLLRNTRQLASGDLDSRSVTSARLGNLIRLPETRAEVLEIARALKADETRDVFLGREASEERAKSPDLSNRRVIAFATHGLVAGDLDGLAQPALALSAPEVTGGKEDGLLTMTEILGLKLNADWIVLSACNTAAADGRGAEAVSGLGRAFFYAGARALLATHWPVESTSAVALTTKLFRRQAANDKLSRAEALRQAMLALIDGPGLVRDGKMVASYAHPLFWAPFALFGDGGARPPADATQQ